MPNFAEIAEIHLGRCLADATRAGVSCGATAAVGRFRNGAWETSVARAGVIEPGGSEVEYDTPYDLASITKPFVAMAALALEAEGYINLASPVAQYLPELASTHGGQQSLEALLSHRAKLLPWAGLFRAVPGPMGSAETRRFILLEAASRGDVGAPPGSLYSDLGYLLAGAVIERAMGRPLDAVVAATVTNPLGLHGGVYYAAALEAPDRSRLVARVAPTERCAFRDRVLRGEVHDENCAAFGGVAGHAGLFGDAATLLRFGTAMLDARAGRSRWLDPARLAVALAPRSDGSHLLGWDGKSKVGSSAGARFSDHAFGHLGFTGTSLWCDPTSEVCAVLLTNRVHPTRDNLRIRAFRPIFHDEVARIAAL